ncbi:hypothetical protein B7G68_08735 [Caulobacter segnis]|uniref:Uncharacterized protein n=2 Tax=Caulobacter segnis TaxID=88688 RepID=D5VJ90_CAUST|nr:lasso peptide biosynthesis protein [Caulobacter segnis]ADG10178.1 conserved hypothetical protein [Caulobacter segnis ATCC 21756]AVQ01924.1 hypothetical protein B7G68_08735 [Caulobacter segnis]
MGEAEARRLAHRFRRAIEDGAPLKRDIIFERFPYGSCGDAALLLGRFLREQGAVDVRYVLGTRKLGDSWSSHAWLNVDGLTVDITADQFEDMEEAVIVAVASPWHERIFELDEDEQPGDYRAYDDHTVSRLNGLYARLLRAMIVEPPPPTHRQA